jgi:hypothetical protein
MRTNARAGRFPAPPHYLILATRRAPRRTQGFLRLIPFENGPYLPGAKNTLFACIHCLPM